MVTVTATGRAVPKAVAVAEIAKRSHGGALHQVTTIDSLEAADGARRRKSDAEGAADEGTRVGEPTANEKEKETNTRRVTAIAVALSRDARALDAEAPGYQFSPETTFTPTSPSSPSAARSDRRRSEKTERRKDDRAHEPEKKNKNAEDAAATPDGRTENGKRRVRRGRGGAKKEKEKEKAADDADA